MENLKNLILFIFLLTLVSCSSLTEPLKSFAGISTRDLEEARISALSQTFYCEYDECYEAVLDLARDPHIEKDESDQAFDVFRKDRFKGFIIVMGINGNIDTTEVAIFFVRKGLKTTKLDVSSLSSSAKRKVAEYIFTQLRDKFDTE